MEGHELEGVAAAQHPCLPYLEAMPTHPSYSYDILESKLAQASHQLEAATSIKETTELVVLLKETALAINALNGGGGEVPQTS